MAFCPTKAAARAGGLPAAAFPARDPAAFAPTAAIAACVGVTDIIMPLNELTIMGMQSVQTVMIIKQAMKGMKSATLSVRDESRVFM